MFVNLTPHVINIHALDGSVVNVAPSGNVARVATRREHVDTVGGVAIFSTSFGEVVGLPDPEEGIVFIVSGLVRAALGAARPDVLAPGELVRGPDGQPIGCRGLTGVPAPSGDAEAAMAAFEAAVRSMETAILYDAFTCAGGVDRLVGAARAVFAALAR